MNVLVILQGPDYGDDRACNGLRLAGNLAKRDDVNVASSASATPSAAPLPGQQLPNGYNHRGIATLPAPFGATSDAGRGYGVIMPADTDKPLFCASQPSETQRASGTDVLLGLRPAR